MSIACTALVVSGNMQESFLFFAFLLHCSGGMRNSFPQNFPCRPAEFPMVKRGITERYGNLTTLFSLGYPVFHIRSFLAKRLKFSEKKNFNFIIRSLYTTTCCGVRAGHRLCSKRAISSSFQLYTKQRLSRQISSVSVFAESSYTPTTG